MPPPAAARLLVLSPELSLAVDPDLLRALLDSCFAPQLSRLVRDGATAKSRLATARALWGRRVPLLVADTFDELTNLATPAGRDALVEAARDTGCDASGWDAASPVDLAARLLSDRILSHAVLVRAHLRLGRLPVHRATYELRAAAARRLPENPASALVAALAEVAAGSWSDAWVHEDDDTGDLHAVLLYGVPSDGACLLSPSGPEPARASRATASHPTHLTVRADAFRFRVSEGRLALTLARPQRLDAYGAAFGRALYGEPRFFLQAPSLTLKPLQALGAAGLAAVRLPPDLAGAHVVECHLDAGDEHRVDARGPEALARLAPHLRAGGYLARATVRFDVVGEMRPVHAVLHLPHRIDVGRCGVSGSGARGPRLAREGLVALGLLSPGSIADDITTLLPLLHPEWRWRELAGDEGFTAMCREDILEEVDGATTRRAAVLALRHVGGAAVAEPLYQPATQAEPPRTIDPDAPKHEKDLVRAIDDVNDVMTRTTDYYVMPDDPSIPAVTIRQSDMGMLRLSLGALMRQARRQMGLARGDRPALPKGVLWVGELRVEGGVVRFFYVVRAATSDKDRAAIGRAVAKAAGFARPVMLVARGRKLGRDCVELELGVKEQLGAASWRGKVAEAVRALGFEDRVAAHVLAPGDARLLVDRKRELAILDGVPLVKLGENGYRLLLVLAEKSGVAEVVPTQVTDKAISGARSSEGATRKTAWKMNGWIESSFAEAGREVPGDLRETGLVRAVGRKGWTLTVRAAVT